MLVEPTAAALGGGSPARVARRLLLATRPMFFTASVLPVLLGSAWGARAGGRFDADAFLLALLAIVCVHGGVNVINDVCDDRSGADRGNAGRIYPYSGGSRFIQNGVMNATQMAVWGGALLLMATAAGAGLLALEGPGVLGFGVAGMALGVLYSVPPVQLSARGLGELAVGCGFGVLPVCGAAWLQTGALGGEALLLSLPVSCWIANVLLVNEVPDAAADAAAGKRTLVVRLGTDGARRLYLALNAAALAAVGVAVARGLLPAAALAVPLLLAGLAIAAARALAEPSPGPQALTRSIRSTLAIHALGSLWLAGWAWLG